MTTADFETHRPYHTVGIHSRCAPRTVKLFVRRAFLRKYIQIIKTLNSTKLKQYYLFLCILHWIVTVHTKNLILTLSFFHNISNNLVKCGTIRNMDKYIILHHISCVRNVSHFFCYVFDTLHICALRFSELLHFLRMETDFSYFNLSF